MSNLLQTAINAALSQDWQKAISINKEILSENKEDINSMSRLAHAYSQTGKLDEAKKLYKKILSIDKYNSIAAKKLDRLTVLSKDTKTVTHTKLANPSLSPSLFIEEPGKTKTIGLLNTAPANVLSHLNPGDTVVLFPKRHAIDVRTLDKNYIGVLPDDFSFRLLKFLKAGYGYEVFVKSATKNSVAIFIKEIKRAKRFKSQPSLLTVVPAQTHSFTLHDPKSQDNTEENDENKTNQEDLEEE